MDIGKGFTFYKEDDKWLEKLGIALGLMILGFLILPVMILSGYAIRLVQNVRDGRADPLPDWNDWGGDLARGFKMWVVLFVWALPIFLFTAPMAIGGAIANGGSGAGEFVGSSILICASCLMFLYGIFIFLAAPGYTISFAKDEHIGSGLQLTNIWQWTQANLGQVIIATLVIMAAGFIVSALAATVGFILCGVGLILTMPLASVLVIFFQHHLYGQLAYEHPMYDSPTAVAPVAPAPVTPAATAPSEVVADAAPAAAAEATDAGEATADAPSPDDAAATVTVTETVTEATDAVVVDEQAVDAAGDVVDVEAAEVTEVSEEATPSQADQPGETTDDANGAEAGDADAQDGPDAPADQQG